MIGQNSRRGVLLYLYILRSLRLTIFPTWHYLSRHTTDLREGILVPSIWGSTVLTSDDYRVRLRKRFLTGTNFPRWNGLKYRGPLYSFVLHYPSYVFMFMKWVKEVVPVKTLWWSWGLERHLKGDNIDVVSTYRGRRIKERERILKTRTLVRDYFKDIRLWSEP